MDISGKGLFHFQQNHHLSSVTKLTTGQTCVCLVNPTLALSQTMGAFVLTRSVPLNILSSVCTFPILSRTN